MGIGRFLWRVVKRLVTSTARDMITHPNESPVGKDGSVDTEKLRRDGSKKLGRVIFDEVRNSCPALRGMSYEEAEIARQRIGEFIANKDEKK